MRQTCLWFSPLVAIIHIIRHRSAKLLKRREMLVRKDENSCLPLDVMEEDSM
jgi:hypothetical protein